MSNIDIPTLESYLFAENKQEFLSKLLPGTEAYSYFTILHALNTSTTISPEIEEELQRYKKNFNTSHYQSLDIKALLKKFDAAGSDKAAKEKAIHDLLHPYIHFSYNYNKPANIVSSTLDKNVQKLSSTLDDKRTHIDSSIESAHQHYSNLNRLDKEVYTRIDTKKIATATNVDVLEHFVRTVFPPDFDDFPDLLVELMKRRNYHNNNVYSYLEKMTLKQLQRLVDLRPELARDSQFVQTLCKKEFSVTSLCDVGKDLPNVEKRELLIKLKTWAQRQKVPVWGITSSALYQILLIDLELNRYDKNLFLEYLKQPIRPFQSISQRFGENLKEKLRVEPIDPTSVNFGTEKIPQNKLIEEYLQHFFETAESVSPFNEFFDSKYLDTLFYSTKLMMGKNLEAKEVLTPEQLKELIQRKELKVCSYNPEYYHANDPVNIALTIKNISSLMIKVFEFRPENFYLKEKKQLDASINLDGLIAAEENNVDFNEPPAKRFVRDFKFESIEKKKRGIFIVDFIGNGISSRCVIRKGRLSFVEEQTVAGQVFTIVSEDTSICKGTQTGIWLKDRFYKADEKGKVLVPYSSNQTEKAVLVHGDFAELADIELKPEILEFKCTFIYQNESFLMGNKAKILFQPRLFLNQQPVGLDIIQSCSAEVVTTSEDNVPSTISFDKLKLSVTEDTELEFPVPAKLRDISINVIAKIVPVGKKQPQEYPCYHTISLSPYTNYQPFQLCDFFLRNTKKGYELSILGKNGEPKTGLSVQLNLEHRYLQTRISETLQTDDEGKISLGPLHDIINIQADLKAVGDIEAIQRTWKINNLKTLNYPETINICQGDDVTLPLLHNELNRHKFSFVETLSNGTVLHNCLQLLRIDNKKLIISGLQEGTYQLHLKDVKKDITITVFKGTYWSENPNYLYTKDTLIDIKTEVNNIVITDMKIQPTENADLADIVIGAYVDQPKLTRFHIFGTQFLENDSNRNVNSLDSNLSSKTSNDVFLGIRKSQYLNHRNLGDEYCYVLDRKSQARYLGNTLEKPKVLLKKTYIRETTTKQEQLSETQEFKPAALEEEERSLRKKGGVAGKKEKAYNKAYYSSSSALAHAAPTVSGFLVHPCLVLGNIKVNDDGLIVIKNFPVKKYSTLQIVASNLTANISESFPLEYAKVEKKDLSQKARDENAVFSINRTGVHVPKGEKIQIKDMSSSKYQVVDSISKLFEVQKNLANFSSTFQSVHSSETNYDTWSFLKEWGTLTLEEKLKKYDKFASHELNLFVYFKDQEFFKSVVLPFLHNKIEKTFVDYFLLDDPRVISEYTKVEMFKDLNSLEQVLVIFRLDKVDKANAKVLANSLENRNSLNKVDINTFKRYFDIVLSSKNADEEPIQPQAFSAQPFSQNIPQQMMPPSQAFGGGFPVQQMMPSQNMMSNYMPMARNYAGPPQLQMQQQVQALSKAVAYGSVGNSAPQQRGSYGVTRTSNNRSMDVQYFDAEFTSEAPMDLLGYSDKGIAHDPYAEKRAYIQAGFQELEKTKEYEETHYYGVKTNASLTININDFWVDVAKHIISTGFDKPFLTHSFIYAHFTHTEMIAVLSLMSLPFKAENHSYSSFEGRGIEIQVGSDSVVLTKAVTEAQSQLGNEFLIMQKFFDRQSRYTESEDEPGLQIEKEVDQYIKDKIYGCTVIVTNLSAARQQIQALVEIPEGAIPVGGLDYTKFHNLILEAYATQTIEYYFYFPKIGKFRINPPNVSKKGKVLAVGKKYDIEVKAEKTYNSLETLDAVLTTGSQDDVLNFARTKNLWNDKVFDFNAIYWLLRNHDFFLKFIQILREKKYFNTTVWQFGFYHKDIQTIQEYFATKGFNPLADRLLYAESSIIKVDKFRLLEYSPLINQRVHLLSSEKNRILNREFEQQYQKYLSYLCERNKFEAKHYLGLVYYLLLQDRVDEALKFFGKIDREEVRKTHIYQLQYDYFCAYLDFIIGYPQFAIAREICQKYVDYPVLSWRSLFVDIANQLTEFDGEETAMEEENISEDITKQNLANAQKEEVVSMEIQQNKIHISHQNVSQITLSFYRVDLEVLFSRNPFITQGKNEFSFIQPNEREQIDIVSSKTLEKIVYEIPQRLQKYNLYIELRTENKTLYETYFSTSLQVHVIESFGQIKVLDLTNKPLTKVYVKCFAKTKDGKVSFYKDGYTDLRGRFDYATLNSNDISNIKKFAIFVTSDDLGSLIKEAKAPEKLGRVEISVLCKSKKAIKK